tara:strand:- start:295 stop:669 length:375 start_codon:yes stop_codon:yes gene_type:complete
MSFSAASIGDNLADFLITDTLANAQSANANVTGKTSGTYFCVYADNTSSQVVTFVKVVDNSSATPNSTVPDWVYYFPVGKAVSYTIGAGIAYSSGLSFWTTSTVASGSAQTDPAVDVTVRILAS